MADTVEELPLFQRAQEFWVAVNAILQLPSVRTDRDLLRQISAANDSITANLREGFEQSTDALFSKYVYYSKGSVAEVLQRLASAHGKRLITEQQLASRTAEGEALGRMMGGFIKYLAKSNFKNRGRHGWQKPPANRRGPIDPDSDQR